MGIKGPAEDMSISFSTVHKTDAGRGIGKMRHTNTLKPWVQNAIRNQEEKVLKIDGENNTADILTKNVTAVVVEKHMSAMRFNTKDTVQQGSQRSSGKQISAVSSGTSR